MSGGAYLRLSAAVVFVILGLWLGAGFLLGDKERSVTAEFVSVSDEVSLAGTIIRDEKTVCAEGEYLVLPQDGQWLCGGDTVAVSRADAKVYFDSADTAFCPADIAEAFSAFYVSKNPESRRSSSSALSALLFGETEPESKVGVSPKSLVTADFPGYFTRYTDGFESLSVSSDFSSFRAEIPSGCIGKLVRGDGWFFVADTDAATAEKLRDADSLTLDGYPAQLWELRDGTAVFHVKRGAAAHLTDREKTLTLSLCGYEGFRLPESAVFTDADGSYIRIQHADGVERLPAEIIYRAEDFCILKGEGLASGMRVLIAQ